MVSYEGKPSKAVVELLTVRSDWTACSDFDKATLLAFVLGKSHVISGRTVFWTTIPLDCNLLQAGFRADSRVGANSLCTVQIAINLGDTALLQLLVDYGADPSVVEKCEQERYCGRGAQQGCPRIKPLHRTAMTGNAQVFHQLLKYGRVTQESTYDPEHGGTALARASKENQFQTCMMLLDMKKDPNVLVRKAGRTILQASCIRNQSFDFISQLIKAGADVNAAYFSASPRRTALQAACENGNIEVVKLPLRNGADVIAAAASHSGVTALQTTAIKGHVEIARI